MGLKVEVLQQVSNSIGTRHHPISRSRTSHKACLFRTRRNKSWMVLFSPMTLKVSVRNGGISILRHEEDVKIYEKVG